MNVQQLLSSASAYWESAALLAALELGVFDALTGGAQDGATLAKTLGCSSDHLTNLLESLAGLGVLEKSRNLFSITPSLQPYLDPEHPRSLIPALRFNQDLYALWGGLADTVRTGEPQLPGQSHLGADPARLNRFVQGMHSRASLLAPALTEQLPLQGVSKLLDVAGGPGTIALSLLDAHPELTIDVFELAPVAQVAQSIHGGHPAMDRLSFLPGDYHSDPLPTGYEAILYCGALHQETPESIQAPFKAMRAVLPEGAPVMVVDLMVDEHRTQPTLASLFGLNMMLMRAQSHMFSYGEASQALEQAGFNVQECGPLPGTAYGLVLAHAC